MIGVLGNVEDEAAEEDEEDEDGQPVPRARSRRTALGRARRIAQLHHDSKDPTLRTIVIALPPLSFRT